MNDIKILNIQANKLVNNDFKINKYNLEKYIIGTIPYSLYSIEMMKQSLKIEYNKQLNQYINFDIINVQFDSSLKEINKDEDAIIIENSKAKKVKGKYGKTIKSVKQLRDELYKNGFTLNVFGKDITYEKLTHTSAKVKNGACTFINIEYKKSMLNYLRLNIKEIENDTNVDWCALNAYESLVMSSIITTIDIPNDRICLVDDENYPYTIYGDVVELNENDEPVVNTRYFDIENCIFDGEGLKDITLTTGHSIDLLRNNFAKCCTLETNILQFMIDNNVEYFEDMFGKKFYKDNYPLLILTPSSIKLFKFKKYFHNDMKETWDYYLNNINSTWGVVKNDKPSKFGKYYNQITYQVLNSILANEDDLNLLLQDEFQYIYLLKTDLEVFKHHISDNTNDITKNFIISMLNMNSDFQYTEMFKEFRRKVIATYVKNLKAGKLKVRNLDYHIMISLPDRLIRTAAKLPFNPLPNKYDCYTTKYKENTQLFTYRNPHISAGNICLLNNTYYCDDIKYFTLSDNVILVNNANSDCTSRWNGADFDSDCIGVTDNQLLIDIYKKTPKFELPINNIPMEKITTQDTAYLDYKISNNLIGEVCNLAALLQSIYFDNNCTDNRIPKYVSLLAVASNCEIDGAKRRYKVDGAKLLKKVRDDLKDIFKKEPIKVKKNKLNEDEYDLYLNGEKDIIYDTKDALVRPMFFKYAQSGYDNYAYVSMHCTLDIMIKEITHFNLSNRLRNNKTIPISSFIKKENICKKSDRHQIKAIQDILTNYFYDFLEIKCDYHIDKLTKKEMINDLQFKTINKLQHKKISKETIYTILYRMFIKKDEFFYNNRMLTLEFLLYSHPVEYKECFKDFENDNIFNLILDENGYIEIWGYKYRKEKAIV